MDRTYYLIKRGGYHEVVINNSLLVRLMSTPLGYEIELFKNPEDTDYEKDYITGTFATYKNLKGRIR